MITPPTPLFKTLYDLIQISLEQLALQDEREHTLIIEADKRTLHCMFRDIQSSSVGAFPVLEELRFDTQGAFPYSSDLEDVIWIMMAAGVVSRCGTDLILRIGDGLEEALEDRALIASDEKLQQEFNIVLSRIKIHKVTEVRRGLRNVEAKINAP